MSRQDRNVLATLYFSVFATVVGVGMVVPLLPVYAHHLGAGGVAIGSLFGAFALARTLFLPWFGRLSDRRGRRTFIVPGLLAYALISLALSAVRDVGGLIVVRFLHGISSAMLMPVIQAYVGDLAPPGREGRMLGLHGTFALVGMSLGPFVGGLVDDHLGLRATFLCMGALATVGFLLCAVFLPPARAERAIRRREESVAWRELLREPGVAPLFLFRFSYVVCIGIIWGFVPLYGALKLSLSSASIGILITLGILASGCLNVPMGLLADRADRRVMIAVGGLLATGGMASFAWAADYRTMMLAAILFGLGGGVSMPAVMAAAARAGGRRGSMGSMMALMTLAHSLGMLAGPLLGGFIMDRVHLKAVFPAGAAVVALGTGAFVLAAAVRRERHAPATGDARVPIDPAVVHR